MTEEEKKQQEELTKSLDERDANIMKSVDEKINAIPAPVDNSEELKSMNEKIDGIQKSLEANAEASKSLENEIASMKQNVTEAPVRKETYKEALKKAIIANADKIKSMNATKDSIREEIELKSVAAETRANIVDQTTGQASISVLEPGVTRVVRRKPFMREIVSVGPVSTGNAKWVEQEAGEGDAAATGENAAKSQVDQDWVTKEAPVRKITAYTKVSEEMLEDVDWAAEEISNDLVERVMLKEDAQIFAGDNTGVNMKGLKEYATAFAVDSSTNNTEFYHAIPNASRLDVLRVAAAIIAKANFIPTHVILHPSDAAMIDMNKSATSNYISKGVAEMLKNITIVENNGISAGDFVIGDMSKSNYRVRKDITMVVGRESDDMTKNMWTIVAELRGCHYVKSNHTKAFVKGTFSSCITAINGAAPVQNTAITSPLNEAGTAVAVDSL